MAMTEKKELAINHRQRQLRGNANTAAELSQQLEGEKLSPWTPALFRLYIVLAAAYLCGCLVCTRLKTANCDTNITSNRMDTMARSWAA